MDTTLNGLAAATEKINERATWIAQNMREGTPEEYLRGLNCAFKRIKKGYKSKPASGFVADAGIVLHCLAALSHLNSFGDIVPANTP